MYMWPRKKLLLKAKFTLNMGVTCNMLQKMTLAYKARVKQKARGLNQAQPGHFMSFMSCPPLVSAPTLSKQ